MRTRWPALNPCDWCPYNKGEFGQTHAQGEHQLRMKVGVRLMLLQAEEHHGLTAKHQMLGEGPGTDTISRS